MLNLEQLKKFIDESSKLNRLTRNEFLTTKSYIEGNQLDKELQNILKNRGQPPLFENLYSMIADKIIGYKLNSISDIEVLGIQKEDRNVAMVLTDILKYITQQPSYTSFKEKSDLDLLCGLSAVQIWVVKDEFQNYKIVLENLDIKSLLYDPFTEKEDFSDAKYFIKILKITVDDAKKEFGGDFKVSNENLATKFTTYYEGFFKKEDGWDRYIFNADRILRIDKRIFDIPLCPIVIRALYKDMENIFYGLFRNIKPLQDFINFGINRMANMIGSQKILFESSAVDDGEAFSYSISHDNAVVRVNDGALREGKIKIENNTPNLQALNAKINENRFLAKQIIGFNDEALGFNDNRLSGVAIESRTNAGLVGLQRFINASDLLDKQLFKVAIALIVKYFTKKQVFKIVEKDTFKRYFTINDGKNNLKVGSYDIEVKTKLKTASSRENRFMQWSEIIKSGMISPELIEQILPLMLDDSDSGIASEIREIMAKQKEKAESEQIKQYQEQELKYKNEIEELQKQLMLSKIEKDRSQAEKYQAQAEALKSGDSGNMTRD